ncbi:DoxX family protein [Aureimonas sp. AU40]|uniref:DoxX family protein n=1 Tax=Aureimonas sp. AU40 TaxID=1637747 RepID=UPI000785F286|nr:DoxX family protein [Aureimonas sp. AU40]
MPSFLARLLESRRFLLVSRVVLTFVFWGAGLGQLLGFRAAVGEFQAFGVEPAAPLVLLSIATLLVGSALVILDRAAWLGTGALATYTGLTILLVHRFWAMEGEPALEHFHTATEHVTVIGALMVMAILSHRTAQARERSPAAAARSRLASSS